MDFNQFLNGAQGQNIIENISQKVGLTKEESSSVVNEAAPVLLGMLHHNASSESGAANLLSALGKHDGSLLDNLEGFFNSNTTSDGAGILGHILGDNQSHVQVALSQKTGIPAAKVSSVLVMLAPIIMGFLGKNKNASASSGSSITDILGGLMGGNTSSAGGGILGSILGNLSGGSKTGGIGDLLGGLFGGK